MNQYAQAREFVLLLDQYFHISVILSEHRVVRLSADGLRYFLNLFCHSLGACCRRMLVGGAAARLAHLSRCGCCQCATPVLLPSLRYITIYRSILRFDRNAFRFTASGRGKPPPWPNGFCCEEYLPGSSAGSLRLNAPDLTSASFTPPWKDPMPRFQRS